MFGFRICFVLAAIAPAVASFCVCPAIRAQDGATAKKDYQQNFDAWKEVLEELRDLQSDFEDADDVEKPELREKWDDLIARGNQLIPELRSAAEKAYLAAPNGDRQLTRTLVKLLEDEISRDDYEPAAKLAQAMIDNECSFSEVYRVAGIASFATNDFESAEKHLQEADSRGLLDDVDDPGKQFFGLLDDYTGYWKEEKELREQEAEADDLPRVRLKTNKGDMVVELFENEAPQTVGNFVNLVEKGFYDGLTFHRVLPGFMAQGGCPEGTGTGGPGYEIYCECHGDNYRKHFRGTLSMAHAGKDTGGSQFFITFVPTPHLNGRHTAFGRVIEGMDVLAKLQRRDPSGTPPLPEPDKIVKAEVVRKRDHEYVPTKVESE